MRRAWRVCIAVAALLSAVAGVALLAMHVSVETTDGATVACEGRVIELIDDFGPVGETVPFQERCEDQAFVRVCFAVLLIAGALLAPTSALLNPLVRSRERQGLTELRWRSFRITWFYGQAAVCTLAPLLLVGLVGHSEVVLKALRYVGGSFVVVVLSLTLLFRRLELAVTRAGLRLGRGLRTIDVEWADVDGLELIGRFVFVSITGRRRPLPVLQGWSKEGMNFAVAAIRREASRRTRRSEASFVLPEPARAAVVRMELFEKITRVVVLAGTLVFVLYLLLTG